MEWRCATNFLNISNAVQSNIFDNQALFVQLYVSLVFGFPGWQIQDEFCNAELEKEPEKCIRRKGDGSGDRDKSRGDGRDNDNRRLSSRDDRPKNENYKDERHGDEKHKDGRYEGKYREDLDRDQRRQEDRHRDERSSRDHTSDRSDSKHHRDEIKTSESHYKESKLQDGDHGGSYVEDHSSRYKDSWGRRRSFDEIDAYNDLRARTAKESFGDGDRARPEYLHSKKIDSNQSNKRPKSSSSFSVHAIKDQSRYEQVYLLYAVHSHYTW